MDGSGAEKALLTLVIYVVFMIPERFVLRTLTLPPTFRTLVAINHHFVLHVGQVRNPYLRFRAGRGAKKALLTLVSSKSKLQ